jgi:DNA polymerase, archaea type
MKEIKGFIVHPTYKIIDGKAFIYLYGRLENKESFLTINEFKPYFYIKKSDLEKAKDIKFETKETNFKNFDDEEVVKIIYSSPSETKELRTFFEEKEIECYEADIRFPYRFMMDKDLLSSCIIKGEYEKGEYVNRIYKEPDLKPCNDFDDFKLKTLSFDIETDGLGQKLYSIAVYGNNLKKAIYVNRSNKEIKIENCIIVSNEKDALLEFNKIVKEYDPDIITGWNVIDFDFAFLSEKYKQQKVPFNICRENQEANVRIEESFMQTSRVNAIGRAVIDSLDLLRNTFYKLEDYKLDTAAKELLGEEKIISGENKVKQIEDAYNNNPKKLIEYNIKDAELVYKILEKTNLIELTIKRSLLVGLPPDRVQASVASLDSLYLRELKRINYVAPNSKFNKKDKGISGGFVMKSKPGIYNNVIVCDFKSLYPSVMRTFNIDPISYHRGKTSKNFIEAPNGARFDKKEGLLPNILKKLWDSRDEMKKKDDKVGSYAIKIHMNSLYGVLGNPSCRFYHYDMADAITHFARGIIQNSAEMIKQEGYEVIYGDSVCKDSEIIIQDFKGYVKFKKISELFSKIDKKTKDGKEYQFLKNIKSLTIDRKGKSVFKKIKYIMRHKTKKKIYRIYFTNYWYIDVTEDHSLIGYINKAKESKLKPLERLHEVKPQDIGNKIKSIIALKNIPNKNQKSKNYPEEVYEFMGYFIGDGSFCRNKTHQKDNKDYYLNLSLGKDVKEILKKLIEPLIKKGFIKNYWLSNIRKGDLKLNGLKLIKIITENCRYNNNKIIPEWLIYEKKENIYAFLRGLFSADGTVMIRNNKPIIKYTSIKDEYIPIVRKLLFISGISNSVFKENSINKYHDKKKNKTYTKNSQSKNIIIKNRFEFIKNIGFLMNRKNNLLKYDTFSKHKKTIKDFEFELTGVIKIEEIKYNDYVYDLEIEDTHRFFANNVLVHNTDSVFMNLNVNEVEKTKNIGKEIETKINNYFNKFIKEKYKRENILEIQFEKLYTKFLMPYQRGSTEGAKKRYAGLLLDFKTNETKIDFTGLEFVRRDWTALAKKFQLELLEKIFNEEEVGEFIKDFVKNLKKGKYDDLLIYRKALRKNTEDYTKTTPPHVKAARILEQNGKLESSIIEYIITTEGPEPVSMQKNKIDYEHYIEKQVKPLADSVLIFFDQNFDDLISGSGQSSLFDY